MIRRCGAPSFIRRAKQLLGWEPEVELKDGQRKTIEYFQRIVRELYEIGAILTEEI